MHQDHRPRESGRPARGRCSVIVIAVTVAFAPCGVFALDLAQSPPGNAEPYVRPNVIISIDDSGSMAGPLNKGDSTPRIDILKNSLKSIFDISAPSYDPNLMPDKKIRLAWQAMWNGGEAVNKNQSAPSTGVSGDIKYNFPGYGSTSYTSKGGANSVLKGVGNITSANPITYNGTAAFGTNSMQILTAAHRQDFLNFVNNLTPGSGTPTHAMMAMADQYMRLPLSKDGPWASEPGKTAAPYLGCRRNYHIVMTDGRWNGQAIPVPDSNRRDNTKSLTLADGKDGSPGTIYGGDANGLASTALYRDDNDTPKKGSTAAFVDNTLADWAFYSWATPLQTDSQLQGAVQPGTDYTRAPRDEFFVDSTNNEFRLDRFWNPKYDPATWPHMVTYTIGFSSDATEWPDFSTFNKSGQCVPGSKSICAPPKNERVPFSYGGSFPDLVTGLVSWPSMKSGTIDTATGAGGVRSLDLWHAALNGRGRFYAVNEGEELERAFRDIFGQINTPPPSNPVASATSGSNITRVNVDRFTAAYEPINAWKGYVKAEVIQQDGSIIANPAWSSQTTADKLDAAAFNISNRTVLSWSDKTTSGVEQGGVAFEWASDESRLSTGQKLWLQKAANNAGTGADGGATKGQQRLNYIRGDHSLEGSPSGGYPPAKPYRYRASRQGDIVNSVIWYTAKPSSDYALSGYADFIRANKNRAPMVYVGGNDGMLHGFAASNGEEKIAYVPRGAIPTLNWLTDPSFDENHHFYVDGSPMTGDVYLSGNAGAGWRTLLVGTMGVGATGYFVLDVTNPDGSGSAGSVFSPSDAKKLVMLDRSRNALELLPADCSASANPLRCAADKDIGFITAQPVLNDNNATQTTQITRMNNDRWAVILGNGYNSVNQRPVLLVQYLDKDLELKLIPATGDAQGTGNATDNGLASPRVVDLNGDTRADIVYAGDNLGNLWKFDLTSDSDANWRVAFGGKPLFTASGPASLGSSARNQVQPITAAPSVRANDRHMTVGTGVNAKTTAVGGLMVAFASGRNVDIADSAAAQVQTLYSVLDNTRYRVRAADARKPRDQQRLEVHPGGGTCSPTPAADCVPAPQALGTGVSVAGLVEQKITELDSGKAGTVGAASADQALTPAAWATRKGWYLDFPAVGERVLKPMTFFDATNILAVYSQVPAKGKDVDPNVESCDSVKPDAERQFRTLINIMDGKAPTVQLVDYNGDNHYNASDLNVSRISVNSGAHNLIVRGDKMIDISTKVEGGKAVSDSELLARMPEQSVRPSWRQLR